jgi:hypothetical protein
MATKSRTSFQKRQKEIARMEKQRDKAMKRMQRKLEKKQLAASGGAPIEEALESPAMPAGVEE